MVDAWQSVCRRRSLIKYPWCVPLPDLDTLPEDLVFLPKLLDILSDSSQVKLFIFLVFAHCLHWSCRFVNAFAGLITVFLGRDFQTMPVFWNRKSNHFFRIAEARVCRKSNYCIPARGMVKKNRAPRLSSEEKPTLPTRFSMIAFTIERPSPMPLVLVVKFGLKILDFSDSGMPQP